MKQLEESLILYHGSITNEIAMDLVTKMAVEQIAKEQHKDVEEVLISFMESNTGRMVYDDSTKLWWDGPLAVAQEYKAEMDSSPKIISANLC